MLAPKIEAIIMSRTKPKNRESNVREPTIMEERARDMANLQLCDTFTIQRAAILITIWLYQKNNATKAL